MYNNYSLASIVFDSETFPNQEMHLHLLKLVWDFSQALHHLQNESKEKMNYSTSLITVISLYYLCRIEVFQPSCDMLVIDTRGKAV